jgi:acyl-CoA thioester hydrolase
MWDLPDPFTIDVTVADEDVDRLGHTNNAVYLRWCEQCAWAHADAVGVGFERWQKLDRAMAIRRSELDYLIPSFAGDVVRVANWIVLSDGRLRASRRFQLVRLRDDATLLRGELHFVCIEISTGKPRRTPPEFARAYVVLDSVRRALCEPDRPQDHESVPDQPGADQQPE